MYQEQFQPSRASGCGREREMDGGGGGGGGLNNKQGECMWMARNDRFLTLDVGSNWPRTKRRTIQLLPTPESPNKTSCSQHWKERSAAFTLKNASKKAATPICFIVAVSNMRKKFVFDFIHKFKQRVDSNAHPLRIESCGVFWWYTISSYKIYRCMTCRHYLTF